MRDRDREENSQPFISEIGRYYSPPPQHINVLNVYQLCISFCFCSLVSRTKQSPGRKRIFIISMFKNMTKTLCLPSHTDRAKFSSESFTLRFLPNITPPPPKKNANPLYGTDCMGRKIYVSGGSENFS